MSIKLELVEKVLDEKVRPYLESHYGNVKVENIEDGIVEIQLLGKCSGCPSAKYTVEEIIETALKAEIPEIKKVELSSVISEELLGFARKILKKNK
ncbi:NifU family protein [Clostridium aestuarii]|uniref:NifU family protein n=1 Tax=Clostridium aestuarii TaxID=338193 RepID=A0ABT4CZB1_9CLOT|nr:NifU family protein [Clostridium aestuarii]MCY6484324.1 NifU family protein [Clostridium aestuarii]